ncbi:5208_t:CDS:1, partial [Acaulospora morrowiae]
YRGFMRIVIDQNTNAEIRSLGANVNGKNTEIHPNLEKNVSLKEYQYVPHVLNDD